MSTLLPFRAQHIKQHGTQREQKGGSQTRPQRSRPEGNAVRPSPIRQDRAPDSSQQ